MSRTVFINGRFLGQKITGVQRFSAEMTAAIDGLIGSNDWPPSVLLAPANDDNLGEDAPSGGEPSDDAGPAATRRAMRYARIRPERIGRLRGHAWEQLELPRAARGGVLVSLGNTAPVLARSRQVVVIHDAGVFDTPESYSRPFRAWYKTLQRALVRSRATLVTVSAFSRDRLADRLGIDGGRITVVSEGADHVLRVPEDADTLTRHGLAAGRYGFTVSNRVAHKRLATLGDAVSLLDGRGMTMAAAGAFYPGAYRDTGDDTRGERRLGRVTDGELRALYANAAFFLFPSRYEGFGLPPLEAMACGCPVIASRSGAVAEICGEDALYFEPGDAAGMRAQIARVLDEPGLAAALRHRGLARAGRFTWVAAARQLGAVVARVG